jgi:uracil-DNA glycosylase family 4
LGEAPGKDEDREGFPFVGAAGRFLFEGRDWSGQTRWPGLRSFGFGREAVRLENVVEIRPPDNHLWKLTPADMERWQADCRARLSKLSPNLIVPMGNLAMNTLRQAPLPLTKRGKWRIRKQGMQGPQIDWRDKIGGWRGGIFNVEMVNGVDCKVIPVFHPANVLRASDHYDVWEGDLQRVMGDSQFPELRLDPKSEHLVQPTREDARQFLAEVEKAYKKDPKHAVLVGDIETRAGGKVIDCFGFSLWETFSVTFDLEHAPWSWGFVKQLLRHPIAKGWHFGLYDQFCLGEKGVEIVNTRWDSHQMHHCLDPRDEHKLGYCASRWLRVKPWKHEGKDKEEGAEGQVKNPRKRQRYCGKDACNTRALIERGRGKLRAAGLMQVYIQNFRYLSAACLRLTHQGFLVDEKARRTIEVREKRMIETVRGGMTKLAGVDLVAKTGLSPPKVNAYFYDTLHCKPIFKRGTRNRTADEVAVRRLMTRYKKAIPMGNMVLDYRQHTKIAQEVRAAVIDDDGRVRSRYNPTGKMGRLTCQAISRNPPRGINAQNRDRHSDLRRLYIADPGQLLLEVDESQAEDRFASGMSGVKEAIELAQVPPDKIDKHILNACKIYDDEYDDLLKAYKAGDPVADDKRQTGKRTKYACWYGMGGFHMSEVTLTETEGKVVLDPDECDEWIATLKRNDPSIEAYQAWVRKQMIEDGCLVSSWGLPYYFKGLRFSKEDWKEGYARPPQHECGTLMNRLGFIPLDEKLEAGKWSRAHIVQQGHDSLIVSTPPQWAWPIAKFLVDSLSTTRTYPGAGKEWSLSMPIGVKISSGPPHSWYKMHEWKVLPSKAEFEEKVKEVTHAPNR